MAAHSSILAWKIPWMAEPGRLHCPWGHKESDTTERLHFHFHFHFHRVIYTGYFSNDVSHLYISYLRLNGNMDE